MSLITMPYLATGEPEIGRFPVVSELTVAQAAKILDGPIGLVNELLDAGLITFRLKNGERLVQWDSLLSYAQEEKRNNEALAEIVRLDQEMGLYDD